MPRRVKNRKHKYLGDRSHGAGNIKNRRGKGSKGGRGRAGYHKHKWFQKIKEEGPTAPKGFYSTANKFSTVSLWKISNDIDKGKWTKQGDAFEVKLPGYKVLGASSFAHKANVTASGFSEQAKKKIEQAGGTANTLS